MAADKTLIKARVLVDCDLGAANDVVEVEASKAKALEGKIDTDPASVEYAESLKK